MIDMQSKQNEWKLINMEEKEAEKKSEICFSF